MLSSASLKKLDNPYIKDAAYTLLFGILSVIFSKVNFNIPGVGNSNLREIPLLIALFHLRNPVFIVVLSLSTLVGSPSHIPVWVIIFVHLVPLFVASRSFRLLERKELPDVVQGLVWMIITVAYYLLFLVPLVVISVNNKENFFDAYLAILPSIRFELIASALVTGLYLMQLEIRKTLEDSNKNLEKIVERRTLELTVVNDELQRLNKELVCSNNEIKELNENLEKMV